MARMGNEDGRAAELTYAADKYQRRSRMLAAIKLTAGCVDCGYDKHAAALEFDHLPGKGKHSAVSRMVMRSLRMLFEEIEKCEVVCSNCHRIRTTERDQWRHPWKYGATPA